jgi:hypothetical protein
MLFAQPPPCTLTGEVEAITTSSQSKPQAGQVTIIDWVESAGVSIYLEFCHINSVFRQAFHNTYHKMKVYFRR